MRKRPKVSAKNLSKSLMKQNYFQQLPFSGVMFHFPHGYLITLILTPIFGTFPSMKITFSTGCINPINIAVEEQFYGEITARLNKHGKCVVLLNVMPIQGKRLKYLNRQKMATTIWLPRPMVLTPTYDMNTLVFISVTCDRSFRFRILLHCDMASMLSFPGFNDCITVKWCIFLNLSVWSASSNTIFTDNYSSKILLS